MAGTPVTLTKDELSDLRSHIDCLKDCELRAERALNQKQAAQRALDAYLYHLQYNRGK